MKKLSIILLALTSLLINIAHAAGEIVIKFSHVVAPDTPKGAAALKFKELAEKMTNGKVKVEVYPNSQLYKDREEIEALQSGAVQMLAPSMAKFGPMGAPEFELFDLPFLFPNQDVLYRVMDGDIGKKLFTKLETKGLTGIAYWDNGFKQMSANKALKRVSDFSGLKMRIQSSKVLSAQMKALGANPQVMAFSEVYSALQQGVVDGTENPVSNFYTQKMNEVQKHMTMSNHGYLGYAVVVNKDFWAKLPADIRAQLTKAMEETTKFERSIAKKDNDDALAKVKASKTTEVYELTPAESEEWKKALMPVHKQFELSIGADLLQAVYKIADEAKNVKKN